MFVPALAAQSTKPSASAASSAPAATNAIVELSPFTVTGSGDVGYRATNTLAGSRMNSSLKDTPAVLDVLKTGVSTSKYPFEL